MWTMQSTLFEWSRGDQDISIQRTKYMPWESIPYRPRQAVVSDRHLPLATRYWHVHRDLRAGLILPAISRAFFVPF